jgi:hypothetical protein
MAKPITAITNKTNESAPQPMRNFFTANESKMSDPAAAGFAPPHGSMVGVASSQSFPAAAADFGMVSWHVRFWAMIAERTAVLPGSHRREYDPKRDEEPWRQRWKEPNDQSGYDTKPESEHA